MSDDAVSAIIRDVAVLSEKQRAELLVILRDLSPFSPTNVLLRRRRDDSYRALAAKWYADLSVRAKAQAVEREIRAFETSPRWARDKHLLEPPNDIAGTKQGAFFEILKLGPPVGSEQLRHKILKSAG